ncbi:MAG TPA: MBL fold metallo-hydrolase [Spirochaetia bacterium]|nr:MBL fold metallo-hydrolase [Spirochaetia bacterium]
MIQSLTLRVLVDDQAGQKSMLPEHGLSFWIEADCCRILFDTGQGQAFRDNARQMNLNLAEVDAVAISHGHYDHTGGLAVALTECTKAVFFMHPDALRARYSRSADGGVRAIGFPLQTGERFRARLEDVRWTKTVTRLHPAVFLTGEIERRSPPPSAGRFFVDPEGLSPDPFLDDQALVLETQGGAVIFLGCSHAGVENTLRCALSHSQTGKLRAVVGGMHLSDASEEEIAELGDALESLGPELIAPCHCTGAKAKEYLKNRFPAAYSEASTGTAFELGGRS